MDPHAHLLCRFGHIRKVVRRAGVRRVRREHEPDPPVRGRVIRVIILPRLPDAEQSALVAAILAHKPAGKHGAHAAVRHSARRIVGQDVHIQKGRCSGTQHLADAQQRCPVTVARLQPILHRHDPVKQPFVKRQIIRTVAEKRHICVRMRVDESRDGKLACAVDHTGRSALVHAVHGGDYAAFDTDVACAHHIRLPHGDNCAYIFKNCFHD